MWCCRHNRAIVRVHPVHVMNAEQCQVAADLWIKPAWKDHELIREELGCMDSIGNIWPVPGEYFMCVG